MLGTLSPTTTNHHADDNGNGSTLAIEHIVPFGCLIDDLFQAQERKIHALVSENGTQATESCANDQPSQGVLGKRSIHDAVGAEFGQQATGGAENAFGVWDA